MSSNSASLAAATDPSLGAFTAGQNRAILITGLACSCISLVAALITLRWFLLMKRLFRHRLVLYLIMGDFFKAVWYFVFPIVVFSRGPVRSSSPWCQAQGFLLAFAIEASDFAILLIALHAMLYIFRPQVRIGKGGLYKYRKWLPLVWLGPPALMASLAFINGREGYVTSGTFCYLPKRPIWYRLALAYIPRYIILCTIFGMYAAISIYVHIKFRSFKVVVKGDDSGSNFGSDMERTTSCDESIAPDEDVPPERVPTPPPPTQPSQPANPSTEKKSGHSRPNFSRGFSYRSFQERSPTQNMEPWDAMNFITSKPLQDAGGAHSGVQAADFAPKPVRGSASTDETAVGNGDKTPNGALHKFRQVSEVPTMNTSKSNSLSMPTQPHGHTQQKRRSKDLVVRDPLQRTRIAIRNQLRFLFIYPAVYALMWVFPFVQNCTLYSEHFAANPIFWLQIVSTAALSLQAAVDCVVFSWREKPWRRVDENSKFAIPFWRDQSVIFIKRMSVNGSILFTPRRQSRKGTTASEDIGPTELVAPERAPAPMWWEEEGRKRKDSVWMGTDLLSKFASKQSVSDKEEKLDAIEERAGSV